MAPVDATFLERLKKAKASDLTVEELFHAISLLMNEREEKRKNLFFPTVPESVEVLGKKFGKS